MKMISEIMAGMLRKIDLSEFPPDDFYVGEMVAYEPAWFTPTYANFATSTPESVFYEIAAERMRVVAP